MVSLISSFVVTKYNYREKNQYKGNSLFNISLNDSYFAQAPTGTLSVSKVCIQSLNDFNIGDIKTVEVNIATNSTVISTP